MNRREFLHSGGLAALGAMLPRQLRRQVENRPNVLMIVLDSLSAERLAAGEDDRLEQPLLAPEVVVDRGQIGPGRARDVSQGRPFHPVGGEEFLGDLEQSIARFSCGHSWTSIRTEV